MDEAFRNKHYHKSGQNAIFSGEQVEDIKKQGYTQPTGNYSLPVDGGKLPCGHYRSTVELNNIDPDKGLVHACMKCAEKYGLVILESPKDSS